MEGDCWRGRIGNRIFFFTMVGANVKAETVTMMDKRQSIEAEMDGIISRLCVPNGPGLQGNLVDSEVRYSLHH